MLGSGLAENLYLKVIRVLGSMFSYIAPHGTPVKVIEQPNKEMV